MNFAYETESKAWATKFLTSHSDLLTLATIPSHSQGSHFVIGEYSVHNRAGSTVVAGIGGRIRSSCWKFYVWDESEYAASSALVDDTTDAQDSGTGDVNLDPRRARLGPYGRRTTRRNRPGLASLATLPRSRISMSAPVSVRQANS
mgnify:CR=1 FL=1